MHSRRGCWTLFGSVPFSALISAKLALNPVNMASNLPDRSSPAPIPPRIPLVLKVSEFAYLVRMNAEVVRRHVRAGKLKHRHRGISTTELLKYGVDPATADISERLEERKRSRLEE